MLSTPLSRTKRSSEDRPVDRVRSWNVRRIADLAGMAMLSTLGLYYAYLSITHPPVDALIFWSAAQQPSFYTDVWGPGSLYVYPPPLAQILRVVPWSAFVFVWISTLFLSFWAATRHWSVPAFVVSTMLAVTVGFGFVLANPATLTLVGNPQIAIAAVCVLGFRWPALWAFPILTKISPGVGLVWFAVRREWRSFAVAAGTTVLIIVASVLAGPRDWVDFLRFATLNAGTPPPIPYVAIPFAIRLPMAVALIIWGAKTDRRWTVPVGVAWSMIALYESSWVTILLAVLPLTAIKEIRRRRLGDPEPNHALMEAGDPAHSHAGPSGRCR